MRAWVQNRRQRAEGEDKKWNILGYLNKLENKVDKFQQNLSLKEKQTDQKTFVICCTTPKTLLNE